MSADTSGGERPLAPPEPTGFDLADPDYRAAVVDLLGGLAYGELRAFSQLAVDAEMAPSLTERSTLALHASQEIAHFRLLADRLTSLGAVPEEAMAPFVGPVDAFHDRTRPSGWLEGLVKVYVGEGIAQDFYREIAAYVDPGTRDLVIRVLEDTGRADFVVTAVRAAIAADERVAGRLALWGRRLVGEAISQAQHVAVERDALAGLLIGAPDRPGADLAELGRLFVRLTDEHTLRMERLGLSA
jgi:hypothetical protein